MMFDVKFKYQMVADTGFRGSSCFSSQDRMELTLKSAYCFQAFIIVSGTDSRSQ